MAIDPVNKNLSNILGKAAKNNSDAGAEIAKIYKGNKDEKSEPRGQQVSAERHVINAIRKANKSESPDVPEKPDISKPDVSDPLPKQEVKDDTIEDLARLYVQQYEEKSGNQLNDNEFKQKVSEVSTLYAGLDNGKERLDAIVFANDGEITVA